MNLYTIFECSQYFIDRDTRVLVANHYSTKRDGKSARTLFLKIKNQPMRLFSDGLQGYRKAFRKVWGRKQEGRTG